VVQPDGKVVVAGPAATADSPYDRFALARYNADGSLDPSFGTNGIVTTSIGNSDAIPNALAWQPDGKLVAAGMADYPYTFGLARYTPDGSLDPGFGTFGISHDSWLPGAAANALVLQPDGKLVAAGVLQVTAGTQHKACAVRRYQPDGEPDPTFGANGSTTTSISGFYSCAISALALQPDGKLVAAGTASYVGYYQFALLRYNADGSLDPSFGTNGIVTTSIGDSGFASAVVLRPNGRLVAGGFSGGGDFVLVGYNADGSLDSEFGKGGISSESVGDLSALAIQPDGKLVAAGFAWSGLLALARYNSDGSLDPSFGTGGTTFTSFGQYACPNQASVSDASALAIQPDGNLIVAGSWGGGASFALARYLGSFVTTATPTVTPTGSPPTAPPTSTTTPTATSTSPATPTVTPTGSPPTTPPAQTPTRMSTWTPPAQSPTVTPLATPTSTPAQPPIPTPTCLPPFTPVPAERPGDLDTTFGAGGIVLTPIAEWATAYAVVVQPDGKVAAAGPARTADGIFHFALARYNAAGSLDSSFGTNGIVTTPIGNNNAIPHALAWQPDGKLVVAGETYNPYNFALVRYSSDGSLDPDFGTAGIVNDSRGLQDAAYAVALQPDGKLVAGGISYDACALRRYQTDGEPDPTFGANGATTTSLSGSGFSFCAISALVLQPDGKLLAAGTAYDEYAGYRFALLRYNADGSLDPSLGTNGIVTTSIGNSYAFARALVLRPDGRLVAGGPADGDFALVGYNPDGSLDSKFGNGGISSEAIGYLAALVIQPDGKLVAAGFNLTSFVVARYDADGSLDSSFGTGGTTFTSLGWYTCPNQASTGYAWALAIQPDGNLIVAGGGSVAGSENGGSSFALARYLGSFVSTPTPTVTPTGSPPTATPT
jgi:uncharacterized delta-60 repeat protein